MAITKVGFYTGRAVSYEFQESSKKGTPQLAVTFEIQHTSDAGAKQTSRMTWFGYLTEAAVDRTLQACRYMGWDDSTNGAAALEALTTGKADLTKNEVELDIQEEDYEGKKQIRIAFVNRIGGGGKKIAVTTSSPLMNVLKASQARAQAAAANPAAPRPAAPTTAVAPPTGVTPPAATASADEIPF